MASKPNSQRDQAARTHSGQSNRRTKDRGESKVVFRSVLANPFEVKWPVIPLNVQNAILARVVELLQGVVEYNVARHKQTRATKEAAKAARRAKRLLSGATSGEEGTSVLSKAAEKSADSEESLEPPPEPMILRHMVIGINAVTKRLEAQCRAPRQVIVGSTSDTARAAAVTRSDDNGGVATNTELVGSERRDEMMDTDTVDHSEDLKSKLSASSSASAPITGGSGNNFITTDANTGACTPNRICTVLVCRSDVDPPLLVAHIPHLVAACNSTSGSRDLRDPANARSARPQPQVKLVSLPKGAESTLAAATGLRRVSVLAFDEDISNDPTLSSLLSSVPTIVAPWLVGIADAYPQSSSLSPDSANADATSKSKSKQKHLQRRKKQKQLHVQVPKNLTLEPTHIKQLRTTAPKDMRLAKALRAKGRAETKRSRKQKAKAEKERKKWAEEPREMRRKISALEYTVLPH